MKQFLAVICALLSVFLMVSGMWAYAETERRVLQTGDTGEDVLALKQRMYELGYFSSTKFSVIFNETTRERLMELQRKNGLKADGIATVEVQEFIFSEACLPKNATDGTSQTADTSKNIPELESDGFLQEGQQSYWYANRTEGQWIYISSSVYIEIQRFSDSTPHQWLEASIRLKKPAYLGSMLSGGNKPGKNLVLPEKLIQVYGNPVFAVNDDFFGYRLRYGGKIGIIIRDGKILHDDPRVSTSKAFPPLDIMAIFEDGTMKTFLSDEHTAQEYIDMGVRDTYSFGPILVQDGKIHPRADEYGTNRSPRMAIGITSNGTIKALDVLGRRKDAVGVSVKWVAERMLEMGCVEALNLDGGNTTCMIFMGDMINRPTGTATKDIRNISGMIGVFEMTQQEDK